MELECKLVHGSRRNQSMIQKFVGYYRDKKCVVETNDHHLAHMLCVALFALQNPREPIKAWDVAVMIE